jgi:hypothetical protein
MGTVLGRGLTSGGHCRTRPDQDAGQDQQPGGDQHSDEYRAARMPAVEAQGQVQMASSITGIHKRVRIPWPGTEAARSPSKCQDEVDGGLAGQVELGVR